MINRRNWHWKPPMGAKIIGSHPIAAQMGGCWLFNESHGLRAKDTVHGGQTDGTFASNPTWGAGLYGPSLAMTNVMTVDGTSPYVQDIFTAYPFGCTILFWSRSNAGSNTLWTKFTANVVAGWQMTETATTTALNIRTSNNTVRITATGAFAFTSGVWNQRVLVFSNANGDAAGADWHKIANYQWYVDGTAVTTTGSDASAIITLTSDAAANFLSSSGTPTYDHFIIWNRALAADEVRRLYSNPICFMAAPPRSKLYTGGAPTPANLRQNFYVAT